MTEPKLDEDLVWGFTAECQDVDTLKTLVVDKANEFMVKEFMVKAKIGEKIIVPREAQSRPRVVAEEMEDGWISASVTWPMQEIEIEVELLR